jgi:hypothetical protein
LPRVDPGQYLVEVADVLRLGDRELRELASLALGSGGLFVTSPSIVTVRTSQGALRLAIGVGSLILDERPPFRHYVIAAPEWVDACRAGAREPSFRSLGGPFVSLEGVAVAVDVSDPVALALNSSVLTGEFTTSTEGRPLLVVIGEGGNKVNALSLAPDGYLLGALSGRAHELLTYLLTLYTSCQRGPP